jgi:hypothetical protein
MRYKYKTPRTDANDLGWQFNEQYGDFDSLSDTPMHWLDFSKMLERELTAVTEQRDRLAEALETLERTAGLPALHDDPARVQARKALQSLNQPKKYDAKDHASFYP